MMAIRLRKVNGRLAALCAAETDWIGERRRWAIERDEIVRRVLLFIPRVLALPFVEFFGIGRHRWPDDAGECLNGCGKRRERQGRASWRYIIGDRHVSQGTACVVWKHGS